MFGYGVNISTWTVQETSLYWAKDAICVKANYGPVKCYQFVPQVDLTWDVKLLKSFLGLGSCKMRVAKSTVLIFKLRSN